MLRNPEQEERLRQRLLEVPQLDAIGLVLFAAADYTEKHGWCGDGAYGSADEICPIVAIARVIPGPWAIELDRFGDAVHERLRAYLGSSIIHWNEHVCRNKEQAVAALRGAALAK